MVILVFVRELGGVIRGCQLGLESGRRLQELAEEAFRDLLKKHRRPITLRDALRESLRMQPANDRPSATVHRLSRTPAR